MIFEFEDKKYSNEQEIIEAGIIAIYCYCRNVKGRWIDIERLMIKDGLYGYWYAWHVIEGRYGPEIETLYLMRHSGSQFVNWYTEDLVRYGNV